MHTYKDTKEAVKHELQQALKKATECGFLDDLAGVLHPDAINQFCDAVDAFDAQHGLHFN